MKKKFFLLLLACISIFALGTISVGAETDNGLTDTHTHCICSGINDIGDHTLHEDVTFTAWERNNSLPDETGNYYLTQNVTISSAWEPADGTVLCLNGHTIERENSDAMEKSIDSSDSSIYIPCNVKFTVTDCAETYGQITHAEEALGCGVFVDSAASLNIYGGNISGNNCGVHVDNGTVNMYKGIIEKNKTAAAGGGVYLKKSKMIMNGGVIRNNTSDYYGGGVYGLFSEFLMNDSTISGNIAGLSGGGVYNSAGGTFTMNNSLIDSNRAESSTGKYASGGGIYNEGLLNLSKSTISNNVANSYKGRYTVFVATGGGISSYEDGEIKIADSVITENYANDDGGGVVIYCSKAEISKSKIIKNTATEDGGGICAYSNIKMSESVISENIAGRDGGGIYYDDSRGNIILSNSEISNNRADERGGGIYNPRGSLEIKECIIDGNTAWQGGGIYTSASDYYDFFHTMVGGSICNNTTTATDSLTMGGGICCVGCVFTIENVIVSKNSANYGGGIYNSSGSILTMSKCEILENTAKGHINHQINGSGGGIYNCAEFIMIDGVIKNNTAEQLRYSDTYECSAGIRTGDGFSVGGVVEITGNTVIVSFEESWESNVYLYNDAYSDCVISISSEKALEQGTNIGITTRVSPYINKGIVFLKGNTDYLKYFFSDSDNYKVNVQDGNLVLQVKDVSVSGQVTSYNPQVETVIQLMQDGAEKYRTTIAAETSGSGQKTQTFSIAEVAAGTYDLIVSKTGHLTYTIKDVVVGTEALDLTANANAAISAITLLAGDLNGDGFINAKDRTALYKELNKSGTDIDNVLADMNGDNYVNAKDRTILSKNLNKSAANDCTISY